MLIIQKLKKKFWRTTLQNEKMQKNIKFLKRPHYKIKTPIRWKLLWKTKQKNVLKNKKKFQVSIKEIKNNRF